MSANWNYMVDFLNGEYRGDVTIDAGLTDAFCLYAEMLLIDPDAQITYRGKHEAKKPSSEGSAHAQV
jgi:hypothetical protein